jgi:hypothetical protein
MVTGMDITHCAKYEDFSRSREFMTQNSGNILSKYSKKYSLKKKKV